MTASATDGMRRARAGDHAYTNFDHTFDEKVLDELRANPGTTWSSHAAWEFFGRVWFDGNVWHEEVWRYHRVMEVMSNPKLSVLVVQVNRKYGMD